MNTLPQTRCPAPRPGRVAVVGAGMVGLSTAWFLQEHGVEVVVLDRQSVAAGASWGNAGWLTPGLATPLPEPAVRQYGVRAVLSPSSPVYMPPTVDPQLASFLLRFVAHSTTRHWQDAMRALAPMNNESLEGFDLLADGGVERRTQPATSFLAAYRTPAERTVLLEEIKHIRSCGQALDYDLLDGDEARRLEACLSPKIGAAIRLHGQRFLHPAEFVESLAASVRARGGRIVERTAVRAVRAAGPGQPGVQLSVDGPEGGWIEAHDAVVIATGTWLSDLVRPLGVRTIVQAGRGYSFHVPIEVAPTGPVYFPTQRVACTPWGNRLRVAGMMEFRSPQARLDPRRIDAIVASARPLLRGADLDDRQDEWVGSRPCTPDGLPLIGSTAVPGVYVNGGHGMWGITLGPISGRLLAEEIVTGHRPAPLLPFEPLR